MTKMTNKRVTCGRVCNFDAFKDYNDNAHTFRTEVAVPLWVKTTCEPYDG